MNVDQFQFLSDFLKLMIHALLYICLNTDINSQIKQQEAEQYSIGETEFNILRNRHLCTKRLLNKVCQ